MLLYQLTSLIFLTEIVSPDKDFTLRGLQCKTLCFERVIQAEHKFQWYKQICTFISIDCIILYVFFSGSYSASPTF
jgi:hypothetical protein